MNEKSYFNELLLNTTTKKIRKIEIYGNEKEENETFSRVLFFLNKWKSFLKSFHHKKKKKEKDFRSFIRKNEEKAEEKTFLMILCKL